MSSADKYAVGAPNSGSSPPAAAWGADSETKQQPPQQPPPQRQTSLQQQQRSTRPSPPQSAAQGGSAAAAAAGASFAATAAPASSGSTLESPPAAARSRGPSPRSTGGASTSASHSPPISRRTTAQRNAGAGLGMMSPSNAGILDSPTNGPASVSAGSALAATAATPSGAAANSAATTGAAPQPGRGLSVDIDQGGIEGLVLTAPGSTTAAAAGGGAMSTTAAGAAVAGSTPGILSLTIPSTPLALPASNTPGPAASSTPLLMPKRKANLPNKSKMMALVGEMLPQNALDPTGYENHEAEAKAKAEEMANQIDELEEGHVELDQFGNRRYKSMRARIRVTLRKKWRGCWKVYDPASPNRQYWSLLVVIFLLYGMVEIPLRVGFEQDVVPWSFPDIFNLLIDCFFLVDIFMNFRTGYFQEDNRLILDGRKIARRYMRSWFLLDLVTSIPLSHILQGALSATSGLAALTLPRLLRVFRIVRLFKILRMLKLMNNVSNWSESANQKLFSLFIKVLKFVTLIFLLSHLSGCIWGYIALQQVDSNGNFHPLSWPYRYGIYNKEADVTFQRLYLLSLYWALCTLTTVGYGDIHAGTATEYAFCIVLTFVGTCCFGYIIGTISSILKHGKETEEEYLHRMMELNLYMAYRKISPYLQKKIRSHYEYLYKKQTLYNEAEILGELPAHLQADLSNFLYKDLILKVPFLADMGPDCSMLVILKLKPLQLAPGAFVFTKGSLGNEMFFVSKGVIDVIDGAGIILCQLSEGSYFGEYAILSEKPVYRTASMRARTFIDLLSLSKNDFEYIWNLYPEIYAKIISRAKQQWQAAMADMKKKQEQQRAVAAMAQRVKTITASSKGQLLTPPAAGKAPGGLFGKKQDDTVIRINKSPDSLETSDEAAAAAKLDPKLGDLAPLDTQAAILTTGVSVADFDALGGSRGPRDHPLGEHIIMGLAGRTAELPAAGGGKASVARNGTSDKSGSDSDDDDGPPPPRTKTDASAAPTSPNAAALSDAGYFFDALQGLSSENDEDYDPVIDSIDLPEHLLPPPKPLVRGSFVPADQTHNLHMMAQARQRKLAPRDTASGRLKSFFSTSGNAGGSGLPSSPTAQRRADKLAAIERANTRHRGSGGNGAGAGSDEDKSPNRRRRSLSAQGSGAGSSTPAGSPSPAPSAPGASGKRSSGRDQFAHLTGGNKPQVSPAEERRQQMRERHRSLEMTGLNVGGGGGANAGSSRDLQKAPASNAAASEGDPMESVRNEMFPSGLGGGGGGAQMAHKNSVSSMARESIFSSAFERAVGGGGGASDPTASAAQQPTQPAFIGSIAEDGAEDHEHSASGGGGGATEGKVGAPMRHPLLGRVSANADLADSPLMISACHSLSGSAIALRTGGDAATRTPQLTTEMPPVHLGASPIGAEMPAHQSSAAQPAAAAPFLGAGLSDGTTAARAASVASPAAPAPAAAVDPTSTPAFWASLQSMLASTLAPLQSQYAGLVAEHAQLQQKQAHTEQLLRNVVAKLKAERAEHAAATAAAAAAATAAASASSAVGKKSPSGSSATAASGPVSPMLGPSGSRQPRNKTISMQEGAGGPRRKEP